MIRSFFILSRMRLTIQINQFADTLTRVPLIRKLNPGRLSGCESLKGILYILTLIADILKGVFGAALYLGLLNLLPAYLISNDTFFIGELIPALDHPGIRNFFENTAACSMLLAKPERFSAFMTIFMLLTLIGGILKSGIIDYDQTAEYSVFLMRMDAGDYIISNFLIRVSGSCITDFLVLIIMIRGMDKPFYYAFLPVLFLLAVKQIGAFRQIVGVRETIHKRKHLHRVHIGISILHFIAFAAGLAAVIILRVVPSVKVLFTCGSVVFAIGCLCTWRIVTEKDYFRLLTEAKKEQFDLDSFTADNNDTAAMENTLEISSDDDQALNKNGYSYFHTLFMTRHRSIMTNSAKHITILCAVILGIIVLLQLFMPSLLGGAQGFLRMLLIFLPFIMYLINRGADMTKAMYINCDHAMLHYSFYREPDALLALFRRRLVSLLIVNLRPALVIAAAFVILPFIEGRFPGLTEALSVLATLAMALFFSVHTLVLYYLLQPFDVKNEIKNPVYKAITFLTYLIILNIDNIVKDAGISSDLFCFGMIGFTAVYVFIGMILVYTLAPKTFRIKE